jgi:two-component system sensor histidine kinase AlgZ
MTVEMSATRPESLLTRAEQLIIAIAIPAIAVLVRLTIALLSSAFVGMSLHVELVALSMTIAMFVPFPLAVSAMVRAVAMRRRAMEIAVLVVFSFIGALISYLWWRWVTMPGDPDGFLRFGWIHFRLYAPAVGVFLSLTAYFIAAIHQHRIAIAEDARRFEAEAESARRARQAIERQMKPGLVVAGLQTVASRSISDPDEAERLLLRLARQQRRLLQRPPAGVEEGNASPPPPAGVDDRAIPAIPSLHFIYPLFVYLIAVTAYDLEGMSWKARWNSAVMTLVSAACWLFIGPVVGRAIRATVAFRLPLAIAAASAGVLAAALFVTALSAWFVHAIAGVSVRELLESNLSVMAWRNSLPALVIGANSLMTAYLGVMVAARAAAARALSETVRAETRALEDRFHPHFLFNALNSIVAFIREDRVAAARMCLQLSCLVERTVAFAGDRWWPVEHELDLIAEYLSIQRIRFGDRLEIDQWDVPSDVRKRPIPRLILQPLLENIFKHAVAASALPIHAGLAIRKRGRGIEISLWNHIAGLPEPRSMAKPPGSGRGLAFVSGRVRDAEGTLTIDGNSADGRFAIRCYIPPPL